MTRYDQTTTELQETLLFACCVAGKNAMTTAKALDKFLKKGHEIVYVEKNPEFRPFEMLRELFGIIGVEGVSYMLKNNGIGCYNHRTVTFHQAANSQLDLRTCTPADLEKVWGIAEKTSRFFVLHTRPNVRYAALDTHIRKHMTALGIEFPKGQPKGKRYLALEQEFLKLADASGMTVAEFDLMLWNKHSGHKSKQDKKAA
jgi:thermostable 8-oxoguanine DNA glycosylase